MKKVYIESNGCAVLRHETYKIAKYVEENNFEEVDTPENADYIIMTGCGVVDANEDFAIETIKRLYSQNKDHAKIIVAGCIPTISKERIENISPDIIQIRNEDMKKFDEIFYSNKKLEEVNFNINPKRHHSSGDPQIVVSQDELDDLNFVHIIDDLCDDTKATNQFIYSTRGRHLWRENDLYEIRVSYGCSSNCSYCATKLAIGDFKSVPEKTILIQAEEAKNTGHKRIMLMGDEIGAWHDNEKNISDLINDIISIDPEFKIGIRYIHPDIIVKYYEQLKPALKNGNIYYFCSAFQSGSERILKLMNRNPNIEPFIECMEDIEKNKYPVYKHTQIIVGFPTESELDVLKTMNALERASFDHVTISAYSKRKGTKSYEMETLPKEIIDSRIDLYEKWLKLNRDSRIYKSVRDEVNTSSKKLVKSRERGNI